jgi:hypothetical protein
LHFTDQDLLHAYFNQHEGKSFNFNLLKNEELTVILSNEPRIWEMRRYWRPMDDCAIYCMTFSSIFKKKFDISGFKSMCDSQYFFKTRIFLVITMMDIFEKSLLHYDFKKMYPEFNPKEMNEKEYLLNLIRREIVREDVVIFETCGFDLQRNKFLMELIIRELRGEQINSYYPYHFNKKLSLPKKTFDIKFYFK